MPNDINLSMVNNGLDFILKSLETIDNSDEELKYSLLNLHPGIQLLLKEILYQKDESLIFHNINEYTADKLRTGNFVSVNYNLLIQRLKNECGIELGEKLTEKMNWLKNERNKAEHYQFVVSTDVLKSNLAQLLSYLLPFLKTEMIEKGYLDSDDERFTHIRGYLNEYDKYVDARLKLIEDEINAIDVPLQCPICSQETVNFIDSTDAFCYFCDEQIDNFTEEYIFHFVDRYGAIKDGGNDPLMECPNCDYETFICLDDYQYICLTCGEKPTRDELAICFGPACVEKIVYRMVSDPEEYEPSFCSLCLEYFENA